MSKAVQKGCELLFLRGINKMADELQSKVKIRFKFRSGEEFEAEGNPDFIEKQRSDFLQLIGKDGSRPTRRTNIAISPSGQPVSADITRNFPNNNISPSENLISTEPPALNTALPAAFRRPSVHTGSSTSTNNAFHSSDHWDTEGGISQTISAVEARQANQSANTLLSDEDIRLWESMVRIDDRLVYLRRKSRQLSADTAALVLIAAAKVLLKAADGYSALLLSKALKKSGYGGERLDRVLANEMRQGHVRSDGTKRSRFYLLSDEGFAKAYVLATKLFAEWQG